MAWGKTDVAVTVALTTFDRPLPLLARLEGRIRLDAPQQAGPGACLPRQPLIVRIKTIALFTLARDWACVHLAH